MPEIDARPLLRTPTVAIRDMICAGICRERSLEEFTTKTHVAFPYRGVFVRHLGSDDAVAEANQVVFFNANESYRVSHPLPGGDASLDMMLSEPVLSELVPRPLLRDGSPTAFRPQRLRIDAPVQALAALLRHRLRGNVADTLEAETLALTAVARALGPRTTHRPAGSHGRQKLADRTKLLLASELGRRWTLAEIGTALGHSPVYLTQVFQQVEGMPLYQYHLRLRLARALDLLADYTDLTSLSLDLGFYSHSHFTTAFSKVYGRSPSAFRSAILRRRRRSRSS